MVPSSALWSRLLNSGPLVRVILGSNVSKQALACLRRSDNIFLAKGGGVVPAYRVWPSGLSAKASPL